MTDQTVIGYLINFRCNVCGTLHHKISKGSELHIGTVPIDIFEHAAQRGAGHTVHTTIEQIHPEGDPVPVYPHTTDHYSVDFEDGSWVATIREMPMLWFKGPTPTEALESLVRIVGDAHDYQDAHPEDRGRFRP